MENFGPDIFGKKETEPTARPIGAPANIKVIGVGGGGGNAVNRMIKAGLSGVDFWLMNTDLQVLNYSTSKNKIQLGAKLTNGLGAGGEPSIGEKAAEEAQQEITEALDTLYFPNFISKIRCLNLMEEKYIKQMKCTE